MSSTPLVSILIPVYNVEKYLSQCLDSIVNQTYKNLQIVIIDDGSNDNSLTICLKYAEIDNRIEVSHQENSGVATTRNVLLSHVKGDYILFIDADDWMELDMVESLITISKEYDADFVYCQNVLNDNLCNKDKKNLTIWSQKEAIFYFLQHIIFSGSLWNKLIKYSIIRDIRFNCNISYGEDALFCWQVLQNTNRIIRTSQQFYHYRMNSNSLSHQNWTPEKKGSSTIVWQQITEETAKKWPIYLNISKARYAIEDMWGLYYASLSNYPYDNNIKTRQMNIRRNINLIRRSKLVSTNKIVACYILAYCYPLGHLLKFTR